MTEVSDEELRKVIGDFLEMGHVDNIVAMFRRQPSYYDWSGALLDDERFAVRLGLTVLFEELKRLQPDDLPLAVPSLASRLSASNPTIRGEAIGLLGIIATDEAIDHVRAMTSDPDSRVREMVELVLEENP